MNMDESGELWGTSRDCVTFTAEMGKNQNVPGVLFKEEVSVYVTLLRNSLYT